MPTKDPKIVILAEAKPKPTYSLYDYAYGSKVEDANKLPTPLKKIYDNYIVALDSYNELDQIRRDAIQLTRAAYNSSNPSVPFEKLSNTEFDKYIATPVNNIVGESNLAKLKELGDIVDTYEEEFNKPEINPPKPDDTFIKEARNVPNAEVIEFYKGYTDTAKVKKALATADKVLMFGHHGDKFGGFNHKEMAGMLKEAPNIGECYMGICNMGNTINEYKDVKDKTFYYRPDTSWLGYNPNSGDLIEGMYSRYGGTENTKISKTPIEYKAQKFKRGGVVLSLPVLEMIERLKSK